MLEINNTTSEKINLKKLQLIAERFRRAYKQNKDISLAIVGPARIKSLNRKYRKIDKATDVLSFTDEREIVINFADTRKLNKYREMFEELGLNIKVISGQSKVNSPARNKHLSEYLLNFLFVHGLLHLAGFDDRTEKGRREMIKKGRDFLEKIGLKPYPKSDKSRNFIFKN